MRSYEGVTNGNPPLDHATARIVAELASSLLPRLKEGLGDILADSSSTVPEVLKKGLEEALASLEHVKKENAEICAALESSGESATKVAAQLFPRLEALGEGMENLMARMEATVLAAEAQGETLKETRRLLESLERALSEWEGMLKADARAQTRELSGFASEVAELLRDTKAVLAHSVKGAVEEGLALGESRSRQAMEEKGRAMEARLARIEKIATASGVFSLVLSAILFCVLILR